MRLAQARAASYTAKQVESIPPELLEKYFEPSETHFVFRKDMRRNVIFGRHDLFQDAPISRVDLLLCRNTLMYFNSEAQAKILIHFHFALNESGYLFLVKSEMLLTHGNLFTPVDLKRRVFNKVPKVNLRDRLLLLAQSGNEEAAGQLSNHVRIREASFDAGSLPQIVIDANGFLVVANQQARALFGITPRDLGRPLQDLEVSYRPSELRSLIEQAYAELERKVTERTAQLEAANRLKDDLLVSEQEARLEAEAANRGKDEFLAMVSHELRTPLNSMLGWIHILRAPSSSESQIIDDILEVSRIITGKFVLNRQLIDLAPVINAAIYSVRYLAEPKQITIDSHLTAHIEPVSGDPNRLQQIIWNLLSNAIKFTPPGGRVEVRLEPADNEARITVSDTGKGITPDFMPYIFDRFRQADASTTRQYSGLGLGLAIVRHIVEMHGGRVQAASDGEDKGSIFTVYLPVILNTQQPFAGAIESDEEEWPSAKPDLTGIWIVEIDDESDARELLAVVLEQWGVKVTATSSGEEVIRLIEGDSEGARPDVLIADIAMPGDDRGLHPRILNTSPSRTISKHALKNKL